VGADWERLLDQPLEAVREQLGISPPPSYEPVPRPGQPPLPAPALRDLLGAFFVRAPAH
jgi:hypothetical protein